MTISSYKLIVLLAISLFSLESSAQFVVDPANTNNIYNSNSGKVGIGLIPQSDNNSGMYPVLSPTVQIRGNSGRTGGTSQLFLPVLKITSPINNNSIGFGLESYGWPMVACSYITTEGKLRIYSTSLEVQGLSFFRNKVTIGGAMNSTSEINTPGNYRLYVTGGILTEKIKVALTTDAVNWADFVFNKDYKLRSLSEVESYVKKHHHLPEIPSSEEVYKDGLDLAQMDAKLLMKIEELTLYMIELKKENEKLKEQMELLNAKIK